MMGFEGIGRWADDTVVMRRTKYGDSVTARLTP
jgi:hypothetical protein